MMVNKNSTFCVYMTPCNYCSKFDKPCNEACNDKGKPKKQKSLQVVKHLIKCLTQPESMLLRLPVTMV